MSSEAIGVLGLIITVFGIVAQIFAQDIRSLLIRAFGAPRSGAGPAGPKSPAEPPRHKQGRRWAFIPLALLALISLALILKSTAREPDGELSQMTADVPGSETDLMNVTDGPNALSAATMPDPAPQQAPQAPAGPFDWVQLKGDVPIWYRTAKDEPLSVYVDAASVEVPTTDTRAFWGVGIPNRMTPSFRRVAYMKAKYRANCSRNTLSMGPLILYDNYGRSIEHEDKGDAAPEREVAPGTNGRAALRFVCSGPNENSVEVLRGGNLTEYLVPNITRAPE